MGPNIKIFLKIKQFLRLLMFRNVSTFRIVIASMFLTCFLGSNCISAKQVDKSPHSEAVKKGAGTNITGSNRIKEFGGEIIIDGSLRVFEPLSAKTFDLVEISTPVTPAANHARIFLRADGTKQSLVILYDDGTAETIVSNQ